MSIDPTTIAANVARGFQVLECQECAEAIRDALVTESHRGQIIELRANDGYDFITCLSYQDGQTRITENGRHVGVRVGDMVFDNLHPDGLTYDRWLQDFEAVEGVSVISITDF